VIAGFDPIKEQKEKEGKGKVSSIMGAMNLLQSKFEILEIELIAKDGAISEQVEKCLTFTIVA